LLEAGERYCGLTYEQLQPLVSVLQEKVHDLASVLSLELPEQQSYVELLLVAGQRLADETATSSGVLFEEAELARLATQLQSELAHVTRRRSGLIEPVRRPATRSDSDHIQHSSGNVSALPRSLAAPASNLAARLATSLQAARQQRTSVTLALFEIDRFSDLLVQLGPANMNEVTASLRTALGQWTNQGGPALLVSDSQLAVICHASSRSDAIAQARQVLARVKSWSRQQFPINSNLTLSAGLATLEFTPKNYPPDDLIEGANRCLSAAQLSGGDTVKSIEF
jgi:GGDEF domain-containing protein